MKLGLFHFQLLYQVLEQIHYLHNEDELAAAVLQAVSTALSAEAGTIFKLNSDGTLYPLDAYGVPIERLRAVPFHTGRGVAGWVVEHAQPVKVDKPAMDQRFGGGIDAITGFKTQSILAAPILAKGRVIGVIEFLNKLEGPFTAPDLELVSMIGREVGIAFENVHLYNDLKKTQALLDATTSSLTAGMLIVDGELKILKINPSGIKILDLTEKETMMTGKPVSQYLGSYAPLLAVIQEAVGSAQPIRRKELRLSMRKGERVIGYSATPVLELSGSRLGTALLFQDITDYQK
jgi:GAF domain-containing protein